MPNGGAIPPLSLAYPTWPIYVPPAPQLVLLSLYKSQCSSRSESLQTAWAGVFSQALMKSRGLALGSTISQNHKVRGRLLGCIALWEEGQLGHGPEIPLSQRLEDLEILAISAWHDQLT